MNKPVNPAAVSRLLAKQFLRYTYCPSGRVRGAGQHSDGFSVRTGSDGAVMVSYFFATNDWNLREERITSELTNMAAYLEESGKYTVVRNGPRLVVTRNA